MTSEPHEGAAPGALRAAEIAEQPAAFQRILDESTRDVMEVAKAIRRADPTFVLLLAGGTSDHAALYAKYLIESTLHIPSGGSPPRSAPPPGSSALRARRRLNPPCLVKARRVDVDPDIPDTPRGR